MADDSLFKPIIPGSLVESRVTETLQTWFETYRLELARQLERDTPDAPRSYNTRPSGEHWTEDQIPAIIVVNVGLDGPPTKSGDGQYEAPFRVGVICVLSGQDEAGSHRNAEDYAAIVRAILVQHRSLGGLASDAAWNSETYTSAPAEASRSLSASTVEMVYTIPGLVSSRGGIGSIPLDPQDPGTFPDPGDVLEDVEETVFIATRTPGGG